MAHVGVTEAARMTGRDPSTIFRALRKGRLSYSKDEAGNRRIDVAELQRVFPEAILPLVGGIDAGNGAIRAPALARTEAPHGEAEAWHQLVAAKDEALRDLRARVDAIEARLDASEAERRQLSERLHGLLTNRSNDMTGLRENSFATQEFPPGEPKPLRDATVSELTQSTEPSASSGLAIPRPPWWRRWFR
jgi:hypothetical protein